MNLNVDKSTVCRVVARFDSTGDVQKAEHPRGQSHYLQKLTEIDQFLIMEVVMDQPGVYLHEIQHYLRRQELVYLSSICNFLHKQGFTRQKMVRVAIQRSDKLRAKFRENNSF